MPIFRWGENWNPLRDLEREVEGLLQGVNLTFQTVPFGHRYPAVNLYELEDEYLLTAEIPGTGSDSLELTVANGVLTIQGVRNDTEDVPDEGFRRHERFRGPWERAVRIPDRIHDDQMRADFNDGVLKIHLPKIDGGRPRQIPVMNGESQ